MTFIEKHKKSLIIGGSTFVIGFVSGQIYQTHSLKNELAQNIFSHVVSQQNQMREDREEAFRNFDAEKRDIGAGWKAMKKRHQKSDEEGRLRRRGESVENTIKSSKEENPTQGIAD